jgi:hypothetical protein
VSSISDQEENLSINDELKKLQRKDKQVSELSETVKHKPRPCFVVEDGVLLKVRKGKTGRIFKQLVVPECLKAYVFKICHDNFTGAHLGQKKTWTKLNNRFYWPNSYRDTIKYV